MGLTVIEMEYMRSQIAQAKAIHEHLPLIAEALERIADALEYQQGDTYQDALRTIKEETNA